MSLPKDPTKVEEYLKKLKEAAQKRHKDPEYIKNFKMGRQKMKENPDFQKMMTDRNKKMAQDPNWIKKVSDKNKEMSQDPNWRQNHKKGCIIRSNKEEWRDQWRGDKNPSWNGGISPLRKSIRESKEMYDWKYQVMERDGYKDVDTGEVGYLEVHHIKPFEDLLQENNIQTLEDARNCKELWDIDNGKTMLKRNHRKFHGLVGEDEGE